MYIERCEELVVTRAELLELKAHECIHREHQLPFSCAVVPGPRTESVFVSYLWRTETNSLNRWVTPTVQLAIVVANRTALL